MPSPVWLETVTTGACSRGVPPVSPDILDCEFEQFLIYEIALGDDGQASGDAEQAEDIEVLSGLEA